MADRTMQLKRLGMSHSTPVLARERDVVIISSDSLGTSTGSLNWSGSQAHIARPIKTVPASTTGHDIIAPTVSNSLSTVLLGLTPEAGDLKGRQSLGKRKFQHL